MSVMKKAILLAAMSWCPLAIADTQMYEGITATPIPLEQRSATILGQKYQLPKGSPAIYAYDIVIKPGQKTNWHQHLVPLYAYIKSGTLTVDYGSKGKRTFEKGESYIEAIDWCHQGLNLADDDLLVFGLYIAQMNPDQVKPVPCDGPQ